jgi:uncharacterized SAM-binding protein YcdF (DUF218 family)
VFYTLSKLLDVLLSPLVWALALTLVGAWYRDPPRRWRRFLPLVAAAQLYLFATEPVAFGLWRSLESHATDTARFDRPYDAVILLGGVVEDQAMRRADSTPMFNEGVERLHETYRILRENQAREALLSGGFPDSPADVPVEARVLARQLEQWGVARERLVIDDRAVNTRENATQSLAFARARGWRRIVAVTSAFHARRAAGCYRAAGLQVDWVFVDRRAYDPARRSGSWLPRAEFLRISERAIREWFGWWIYRARGFAR